MAGRTRRRAPRAPGRKARPSLPEPEAGWLVALNHAAPACLKRRAKRCRVRVSLDDACRIGIERVRRLLCVNRLIALVSQNDPHLPFRIFLSTGRCTLVAAVRWIHREKQKSVRAVIGGRLPAIHAKSQLTGGFQHARRRGIDPFPTFTARGTGRSRAGVSRRDRKGGFSRQDCDHGG